MCLFFLPYIPISAYHIHWFVNFIPKHVNRHSRLIYEANLFNKKINNFNKLLNISTCSVGLDIELNVIVDTCMNSNFYKADFYSLLQFIRLNIFKALAPERTSISISQDLPFLCLLFFLNIFLGIFKEWAWKEAEMPFNGFCFDTVIL